MCPPADKSPYESPETSNDNLKKMVGGLSVLSVGLLISTIVLATNQGSDAPAESAPAVGTEDVNTVPDGTAPAPAPAQPDVTAPVPAPAEPVVPTDPIDPGVVTEPTDVEEEFEFLAKKWESSFYTSLDANVCAGAKLSFDNKLCVDLEVAPQAGANVTKGFVGNMDVGELKPNTNPYFQSSMCPVNVHWHLGTEHYSYGEYDENGDGPHGTAARPDWADRARALAEGSVRDGFRCNHYDATDEKFTKPYEWKHCEGMEVGETYEVHWPHSAAGACGTTNQYQTPFYDGVFCNLPMEAFVTLGAQDIASAVGVHGQVFTIVNDDSYYYADMIRGMIVDGEMGKDVHIYTGSTTGTSRDNEMCSQYAPITWQVDRKCHMISASSFDKMCFDMKMQRDDMSGDLHAHGSRELVHDDLSANNQHYEEVAAPAEPAAEEAVAVEPSNRKMAETAADADAAAPHTPSFLDLKYESNMYTDLDANTCAGAKLAFDNKLCADLGVAPQAGANVTKGYVGNMDVGELKPNTNAYFQSKMCPVNVHWHLGTEHYSYGEYDENGDGPHGNAARPDWADRARALATGSVRDGFRCNHYDATDEKFTKPYEWKHCEGMEVGETYEVHWPHSSVGACNTPNQYQTPFYDGVFCNLPMESFVTLSAQDIAANVGVHGQVFTIVNDEEYFYSDMIRGMVIDDEKDMGKDIHIYTGSTTGTSRDNEMCSQYAPITWQVDRKCHMISASSFDKMCSDMKAQRDDMSGDLHAHGSRELVHDDLSANNQHYPEAVAAAEPAAEEAVAVEPSNRKMAETEIHAEHTTTEHTPSFLDLKFESNMYTDLDANTCAGAKLAFDNKLCADLEVAPQAGANVTKGYVGNMDVGDLKPNTNAYFQSKMCPVNVHWHLGTEHYSYGQYDENGDGPHGNIARPDWADRARALAEGSVRDGFRCNHYDADDEKFTKPYEWKHCEGMEVGETYEVHWPHSSVGACNTPNQYQTPFYDGVFCNLPMESFVTLSAQDIAANVGVHGQVFTIVNDEEYFYSDMIRGMVIDDEKDMGKDIHIYTGSTTGTSRDNEMCSQYAPITWQVDRKCHMISASSFDKMCSDMKAQRDDMSGDLHAHGSRELVHDDLAANNQHYPDGVRKNLRA